VEHEVNGRLIRGLHRWDLVALVINATVGAGIFGLPSRAFALAGTYSLFAYAISALALYLIVLCFAEVGSRFSSTGGPYLYARATFGPLIGFQVGWLLWLARITAIASLANLFVGYLAYFVPAASPWRSTAIVVLVSSVAIANITGIKVTKMVTNALTVGKLIPLLLFGCIGLFFVDPQRYSLVPLPSYQSFSEAALLLVFAYVGFESAVIPSGEMRDPARHLPFALITGFAVIVSVYMLVQFVCIGTLPELASSERPLADASTGFLGSAGASVIAAGALVSIGGTLNALMFSSPRLLFAMAGNRQLPSMFSATHARFRTPVTSIAVTGIVALIIALFSTFMSAVTISAVVRLMAYATTCAALIFLRRRSKSPQSGFRLPAGPAVAAGALVLIGWLLSNTQWTEIRLAGIAVLLGFVLYLPGAWTALRPRRHEGVVTNDRLRG
jgi:basic amino acid/polyamine antiporter, APA family